MTIPPGALRDLLAEITGIELGRGGLADVLGTFVRHRIAELGLRLEEDYLTLLRNRDQGEVARLVDVVSVPHTWFMRDLPQLSAVVEALVELRRRARPLYVWVPGCATGEDVYSIALLAERAGVPVEVTGTDISERSLERARQGVYGPFSLRELPESARLDFELAPAGGLSVGTELRRRVRFVQHNLMDEALRRPGGWDLILCRNVFIYFSPTSAARCAEGLAATLNPAGVAFFGAGELITCPPEGVRPELISGRVAYRLDPSAPALGKRSALGEPFTSQKLRVGEPWGADAIRPLRESGLVPSSGQGARPLERDPPQVSSRFSTDWGRLLAREDLAPATEEALQLSARSPLDPGFRLASGILLYSSGDYRRAVEQLRSALLLEGRLWVAAVYQGLCLEGLGNREEALALFRCAQRLLEASSAEPVELPAELSAHSVDLRYLVRDRVKRAI